ncbi:MAG: hypothetical protein ABI383_06305 [Acidobacteriaceae bacterium]
MSKSYEDRARERYTENKRRATDRAKADLAASKAKVHANKSRAKKSPPEPPAPKSSTS